MDFGHWAYTYICGIHGPLFNMACIQLAVYCHGDSKRIGRPICCQYTDHYLVQLFVPWVQSDLQSLCLLTDHPSPTFTITLHNIYIRNIFFQYLNTHLSALLKPVYTGDYSRRFRRRQRRLSQKTATVFKFGDSRRFRWQCGQGFRCSMQ